MSTTARRHSFISYLLERSNQKGGKAMLAALRRGLGAEPGDPETAGMMPYVVPRVRKGATRREEADMYMIASLFALHPSPRLSGNMGEHMRELDPMRENDATERRFIQLLRMRRDTLEPRLRQQISILKSSDVQVNWHQLIWDVRNWDDPDRFVQRNWARKFWGSNQSESESD